MCTPLSLARANTFLSHIWLITLSLLTKYVGALSILRGWWKNLRGMDWSRLLFQGVSLPYLLSSVELCLLQIDIFIKSVSWPFGGIHLLVVGQDSLILLNYFIVVIYLSRHRSYVRALSLEVTCLILLPCSAESALSVEISFDSLVQSHLMMNVIWVVSIQMIQISLV